MDPLISIVRNWSVLGGAQVISSLITVAVMVIVSRTLGDAEFGRLFLALTLATIFGVFVDFGLSQVVTRVVAREPAEAGPYLRKGALVVGGLGAGLYLGLLGFTQVLGYTQEVHSLALILGLLIVVEGFSQLLGAFFQAHERMLVPAIARMAGNAITLALVVPLLMRGYGAAAVAIVMVLAAGLRVLIQAGALRRLRGFQMRAPTPPSWRGLLAAGFPFLVAQGLGILVIRIDVIILGLIASEATVGWYGAASRVVEAFNFVPLMLTMAVFPVASRLWVSAPAEFQATVRKTLRLVLIVTVPAAVTLFVLADDVIGVLFTLASFGPAVPILRIQAISLALVYVDYLLVCILMAVGRERTWIAIVAASCLLNPALNWVLIPAADAAYANGAVGAALAKLGTEVFFLVCTLRALPSGIFGAESARFAVGSAALGALLGLALFATRAVGVPWMLAAVVAGAGYLAVAVRLGLMPPDITSWVAGAFLRRRPARIEQAAGDIGSERSPSADAA